jgi:hypothetical protein
MVLRDEDRDINAKLVGMYFRISLARKKIFLLFFGINIVLGNKHTDNSQKNFEYLSVRYNLF